MMTYPDGPLGDWDEQIDKLMTMAHQVHIDDEENDE